MLTADLSEVFAGADCVVHLAWLIQPSRDRKLLDEVNIRGTARVARAVADAKVPAFVVASSVGTYSEGPKDRQVDESWPREGIDGCYYSEQKVAVEQMLDQFENDNPSIRVVRMRPAIILKDDAAAGVRRLFLGPMLPNFLVRRSLIPVVPRVKRLAIQVLNSRDVADAYRRAVTSDASGAFNLATEPVITPRVLADLLGARQVPVDARVLRGAAALTWKLRLQPTHPSWVDMGLGTPLLDSSRAKAELGWEPRWSAHETLTEFMDALRDGRGFETPPLAKDAGGQLRRREFTTGVGARQ